MSKTVDQKIVEMQFDNQKFEKGVNESMSSIDKLKNSLDFSGSEKAFNGINNAAKGVTLDSLVSNIDKVKSSFDKLEMAAAVALGNIMTKALEVGAKFASSLSLDQVKAGWEKYAEETQSVQTIMNATGEKIDTVEEQLARLAWFSDETSYSYTDMTSNVGKFTSQSIKLDKAVTAMEGISTWASLSGANVNAASRAMYNLSQALGLGAVRVQDWMSIENANMATAEFKKSVMDAAVEIGTLYKVGDQYFTNTEHAMEVTVANFRSTLQENWFSNDVLETTLYKYGHFSDVLYEQIQDLNTKVSGNTELTASTMIRAIELYDGSTESISKFAEAEGLAVEDLRASLDILSSDELEFGKKAFIAAQQATTFAQAIDATKDAVSTQWKDVFKIIFGNYEEAKVLWTDLSNWLYDLFTSDLWNIKAFLQDWSDLGGRDVLFEGIYALFDTISGFVGVIRDSFSNVFGITGEGLYKLSIKFRDWAKTIALDETELKRLQNILESIISPFRILFNIVKTILDFVTPILSNIIFPVAKGLFDIITAIVGGLGRFMTGTQNVYSSFKGISELTSKWYDLLKKVGDAVYGFLSKVAEYIDGFFDSIFDILHEIRDRGFKAWFSDLLDGLAESSAFGELIVSVIRAIGGWIDKIVEKIKVFFSFFKQIGDLKTTITQIKEIGFSAWFDNLLDKMSKTSSAGAKVSDVIRGMKHAIEAIGNFFKPMIDKLTEFFNKLKNFDFASFKQKASSMSPAVADFIKKIEHISDAFEDFASKVKNSQLAKDIKELFTNSSDEADKKGGILDTLARIGSVIVDVATIIWQVAKPIFKNLFDIIKNFSLEMSGFMSESFKGINTDTLVNGGLIGFLLLIVQKFQDATSIFKDLGNFKTGALSILDSLKGVFISWQNTINADILKKIAGAVVLLTASLVVLALIDEDALMRGTAILGLAVSGLVLAIKELAPLRKTVNVIPEVAEKVTQPITGIMDVLKNFASGLNTSLQTIANAVAENIKKGAMTTNLIKIGIAIGLFVAEIAILGHMDTNALIQGSAAVMGVMMAMMATAKAMDYAITDPTALIKTSASFIIIGVAIRTFVESIRFLINMDPGKMVSAIGAIGVMLLGLIKFTDLLEPKDLTKFGAGMSLFALALLEMTVVTSLLIGIPLFAIIKAVTLFSTMSIVTALCSRIFVEKDMRQMNVSIILFAAAINVLTVALLAMNFVRPAAIGEFALAITAFAGAFIGLNFAMSKLNLEYTMKRVASAILMIGEGAALTGVGFLAFSLSLERLAKDAELVPKAMESIGNGIIALSEVLAKGSEKIAEFAAELVMAFIENVLKRINDRIDTITGTLLTIAIKALQAVAENADQLISLVIDILIKVFKGVSARAGELIGSFVDMVQSIFGALIDRIGGLDIIDVAVIEGYLFSMGAILKYLGSMKEAAKNAIPAAIEIVLLTGMLTAIMILLSDLDTGSVVGNSLALAGMVASVGGTIALLSKFNTSFGGAALAAVKILEVLAILVAGFTAIELLLGLLAGIDGAKETMQSGVEILQIIGDGIGKFIGSIITGVIGSFVDSLPGIAEKLSEFMAGLKSFADSSGDIDSKGLLDSCLKLAEVVLVLTSAELMEGISNWSLIFGDKEENFENLKNELVSFGSTVVEFGKSVKSLSPDDLDQIQMAANAAKIMAEFAKEIPREGGLWQDIAGEQDISSFGDKIVSFAESLIKSVEALKKYEFSQDDVDQLQIAADAGYVMTSFADTIPKQGLLQAIIGEQDIADFGLRVQSYVQSMIDALILLRENGFDNKAKDDFQYAVNAGNVMKSFVDTIPEKGLFESWADKIGIDTFIDKVIAFIGGMVRVVDYIIENKLTAQRLMVIEPLALYGTKIADLMKAIPTDVPDGSSVKDAMTNLGEGISEFTKKTSNVDFNDVKSASENITTLFSSISTAAGSDVDKIGELADALLKIGTLMSSDIKSTFELAVPDIQAAAGYIMDALIIPMEGLPSKYASYIQQSLDAILIVMGFSWTTYADGVSVFFDTVFKPFTESPDKFKTCGEDAITAYKDAMVSSTMKSRVKSSANDIAEYAATELDLSEKSAASGGNFLAGFINGMYGVNGEGALKAGNAAYEIGKKAVEGLNAGISARSPSRLTMQSGKYFSEGFIIGITSEMDSVDSIAKMMGEESVNTLRNSISKIADVMDSDMDFSPTITPVMDLSEIQNGIGTMNGYLLNGNYQIGGVSANLARNIGNNVMQTQLNAISELTKELSDIKREPANYNYTQINNSPKSLSRLDIYRNTKNLLSLRQKG